MCENIEQWRIYLSFDSEIELEFEDLNEIYFLDFTLFFKFLQ